LAFSNTSKKKIAKIFAATLGFLQKASNAQVPSLGKEHPRSPMGHDLSKIYKGH
jgi:hypothetical protein